MHRSKFDIRMQTPELAACLVVCRLCHGPLTEILAHFLASQRHEQNALQNVSSPTFKTSKLPSSAAVHPSSRNARKRYGSCVPAAAATTCIMENRSSTNGITLFMCWIARKTSGSSPAMTPSSAKVRAMSRMIGGSMRGSCIWEPARGATRPKLSCTIRFTSA